MISNKAAWIIFFISILSGIFGIIRLNILLIGFSIVSFIGLIIIGWNEKRKR